MTSYSWHQSHDQATVLLNIPHDQDDADILIVLERNQILVAGIRGQSQPIVKGRLYGNIVASASVWQLESHGRGTLERQRTSSNASSSSYAFVSDPEEGQVSIGTSFAASLASDSEDVHSPPALQSPIAGQYQRHRLISRVSSMSMESSRPVSPGFAESSYSSLESSAGQRLLTLHLEKEDSAIWPSLVVGPVAESFSPSITTPIVYKHSHELEHTYNMDPTSLVLMALELFDIKGNREEAFEYFLRAWHHARVPAATMRLVTHYLPWHLDLERELSMFEVEQNIGKSKDQHIQARRGTPAYYLQCMGGLSGVAELYLEAGMLYLDGAASTHKLRTAFSSSLSSIRIDDDSEPPPSRFDNFPSTRPRQTRSTNGTTAWLRDREYAAKYFDRARALAPELDVPILATMLPEGHDSEEESDGLEIPYIELRSGTDSYPVRKRRVQEQREKKLALTSSTGTNSANDFDASSYFYSIIGTGSAILFVGVVGALSLSTWRRNQSS